MNITKPSKDFISQIEMRAQRFLNITMSLNSMKLTLILLDTRELENFIMLTNCS